MSNIPDYILTAMDRISGFLPYPKFLPWSLHYKNIGTSIYSTRTRALSVGVHENLRR